MSRMMPKVITTATLHIRCGSLLMDTHSSETNPDTPLGWPGQCSPADGVPTVEAWRGFSQ
jgi:hypothetical protein